MKKLNEIIAGRGSVKGKVMKRIRGSSYAYLYECTGENFSTHYEVFRHKENTYFDCVSYPGDEAFGKWAWTYKSIDDAMFKYYEISTGEREENV
jgi:hypothetical protein